jgi:hypothetical protein
LDGGLILDVPAGPIDSTDSALRQKIEKPWTTSAVIPVPSSLGLPAMTQHDRSSLVVSLEKPLGSRRRDSFCTSVHASAFVYFNACVDEIRLAIT